MTTVYFVRHGHNDWLDRGIAGRTPGVHLSEQGKDEMARVAEAMASWGITGIISSPLERAQESASPLAGRLGLPIETDPDLNEVDFGDWNGRTHAELDKDPRWLRWNTVRGSSTCPGGEAFADVFHRVGRFLRRMEGIGGCVAAFSHGDPIKTAVMNALSVPMDFTHRIEISPASVTAVELTDWGPRMLYVNRTF